MKHGDIGSLTASETVLLDFTDDERTNCSNRMNSEVHRSISEIFTSKQMLQNASVDGFLASFNGKVTKNYGQKF